MFFQENIRPLILSVILSYDKSRRCKAVFHRILPLQSRLGGQQSHLRPNLIIHSTTALQQFRGNDGHGSFLGADVSGDLDGVSVGLRDGDAVQVCADEGSGEGVPGSDGADYFDLRGALEAVAAFPEDDAAVDPFGENDHLQAVGAHQAAAEDFLPGHLESEESGNDVQFILVELQDIGPAEAFADGGLGVVTLSEVDIADSEAIGRTVIQEEAYTCAGVAAPLRQGAEADGLGVGGDGTEFIGKWDVAPGYLGVDGVDWGVGVAQIYIDGTGGVRDAVQMIREGVFVQLGDDGAAQLVQADGAHHQALVAQLRRVIGKVGRGSAQALPFRELIPQDFSKSDDKACIHIVNALMHKFTFFLRNFAV